MSIGLKQRSARTWVAHGPGRLGRAEKKEVSHGPDRAAGITKYPSAISDKKSRRPADIYDIWKSQ